MNSKDSIALKLAQGDAKSNQILAFQDYGDCEIPHKAFPHNSRDIQQRTRLNFSRKQWVTNWGGRRQRTIPRENGK